MLPGSDPEIKKVATRSPISPDAQFDSRALNRVSRLFRSAMSEAEKEINETRSEDAKHEEIQIEPVSKLRLKYVIDHSLSTRENLSRGGNLL